MFFLEQNEGSSGSKYFKLVHKKKTHDNLIGAIPGTSLNSLQIILELGHEVSFFKLKQN